MPIEFHRDGPWQLPEGWVWTSLGDVCLINRPPSFGDLPSDLEIPFVPMAAVSEETGIVDLSQRKKVSELRNGYTRFQSGDVLFAKITPCMENGKGAALLDIPRGLAAGSTEFHTFRSQALDPRYLWYWLVRRAFRADAQRNMRGAVGQLRVPLDYLREVEIAVPPLAEQRRIVARIDELFTEIADGDAALGNARDQLDTWRRALLKAAVTGELTREWRHHNKIHETSDQLLTRIQKTHNSVKLPELKNIGVEQRAELPDLPSSWVWARAGQLCGHITKGTTPKSTDFCSAEDGIPFIKVYNLTTTGDLDFEYRPSFIRKDVHEGVLARSRLNPGDVLMNIVGPPLGKISIVPPIIEQANCNQAIAIFRPRIVSSQFLALAISTETVLQWAIKRSKASVGQINLTLEICRDLPIPLPPLDEQIAILERLNEQLSEHESAERCLSSAELDKKKIRQSVLKAAFEGRLAAQDPHDEPAGPLLTRLSEAREADGNADNNIKKLEPFARNSKHVIATLDPAIHSAAKRSRAAGARSMRHLSMDARVKPAHDE